MSWPATIWAVSVAFLAGWWVGALRHGCPDTCKRARGGR